MDIDHVVIWVKDSKHSLDFYVKVLGMKSEREDEFLEGKSKFPSVRINENTIFDLMERDALLPLVRKFTGAGENIGGAPINHICLSMSRKEYENVIARLDAQGIDHLSGGENVFGAQGKAVKSTYFNDPDGNVLEIRFYEN